MNRLPWESFDELEARLRNEIKQDVEGPTIPEYFEAKHDQGKTRWDLLPWDSLEGVAQVLTFGAEKYAEDSWREVPEGEKRYFSAMIRHWRAMKNGEKLDPESGLPHRFHFLCNAGFLCELTGEAEFVETFKDSMREVGFKVEE